MRLKWEDVKIYTAEDYFFIIHKKKFLKPIKITIFDKGDIRETKARNFKDAVGACNAQRKEYINDIDFNDCAISKSNKYYFVVETEWRREPDMYSYGTYKVAHRSLKLYDKSKGVQVKYMETMVAYRVCETLGDFNPDEIEACKTAYQVTDLLH